MSYQLPSSFLQKFTPKEIHELKRVFKEHDHDYAAAIALGDLPTVLLQLGENVSSSQVPSLLNHVNLARSDVIDFQEFLTLLYDYRRGFIQLEPVAVAAAPVLPTPPPPMEASMSALSLQDPAPPAPAAPAPTASPVTPPVPAGRPSWPPATATAAPVVAAPAVHKAQWPPAPAAATPAPSQSAQQPKPQWPPAPAAPTQSAPQPKPQWPPAAAQAPAPGPSVPQGKPQWPPAHGAAVPSVVSSNDVPSGKPQWPPTAANQSPQAPAHKAQWPPSASAESVAPGPKQQWPPSRPAANEQPTAKPQWPPAAGTAPVDTPTVAPGVPQAAPTWPSGDAKPKWPPTSPPAPSSSEAAPASTPTKPQWPPAPAGAAVVSHPPPPPPVAPPVKPPSPPSQPAATSSSPTLAAMDPRRRSLSSGPRPTGGVPAKIHEVKGSTGGLHSYSEEEKVAFSEHINNCLYGDKDLGNLLPINVDSDGLFSCVSNGVLLCKLINAAVPDTIDVRALNRKSSLNVYEKTENHNLCINAAKSIGCSVVNIGPADLIEGKPILVLGLTWQIIKIQLTSTINLKNHPELVRLLYDGETLDEFMQLPPDQILLRWMNYQLKAAGHSKQVTNFGRDVQDAVAYSVLLHHIAPDTCDLCQEADAEQRAAHVISNAVKLKVEPFIKPRDITSGNPKLNMGFVAQLFNNCPNLQLEEKELKQLEDILYDDVGDTREERVFRMWINSLGIDGVYINHLFSDLRDGINLLKVYDRIEKGIVAWTKVNLVAPNKFKKVENCNYCVVLGKQLKFSLVNIGGADINEGNKKLLLSIIWQAMRYQQLKILSSLAQNGREITDKDIIDWANHRVQHNTASSKPVGGPMVQFRDGSLSDSLYLLNLVHAIEPRAVNWEQVTEGKTDEDKASNAKYAISCARKIGATVFLTFEDIVEVKPRMIMTFVATLMSLDLHAH